MNEEKELTDFYKNDTEGAEDGTAPFSFQPPYRITDGQLCLVTHTMNGEMEKPICNFVPWIEAEIVCDDGREITKTVRIRGKDREGNELPAVDVPADEIDRMKWLNNRWPAYCRLNVIGSAEKHLKCALLGTAAGAEQIRRYSHTGWKKIDGEYAFLLPGIGKYEVVLHGKQNNYRAADHTEDNDLAYLNGFLGLSFIPHEICFPCLALVFLSPMNEFLKACGHEPKFILTLIGRTGSMKSTVAALMLSFFGEFSATDLPMSFRDTKNSILHNAYALKDVLTCIDDYHPTGRNESSSMRETMQMLARGYGDRAARNRLDSEIQLRESRPPQGNVIVTAEYAPDITESGTARLFCIEMKPGSIDLSLLTEMQGFASDGILRRCMYAYLRWIKDSVLSDDEREKAFVSFLGKTYPGKRTLWRDRLKENRISFHDRLPDTLTCLELGFSFLLRFMKESRMLTDENEKEYTEEFRSILLSLSAKQSEAIADEKPTHIFVKKLMSLIESGQVTVLRKDDPSAFLPSDCVGYEDGEYWYLFLDSAQKYVKRLCDDQNESYTFTSKAIAKALSDEGLIEIGSDGKNTRTLRFGGKSKRVMLLRKEAVTKIIDAPV